MSSLTICNAQKLLPIKSACKSYPTGAIDIEFTSENKAFYLSQVIDWTEGDSYTIKFREPTPNSDLSIGNDIIPKGVTSFQGFNPTHDVIHWMASNGEYFEAPYAYICLVSNTPTKISISEITINRRDGSSFILYYPDFSGNRQFDSWHVHWEAKTGEEFEKYVEFAARLYKVVSFSAMVSFGNEKCYIGGPEWANTTSNSSIYRLKLYSPIPSDKFAWKYVTKSGETRYQKIDKNSIVSTLSVDEAVTECYIVPLGYNESTPTEYLEIKEVSLIDGSNPKYETLVLWHANGKTTEISLSKKPRVTFSADILLVKGSGINFEYPLSDIVKFTYKKEDIINDIDNPINQTGFTRDDEKIVFTGIKSTDEVALYKLNGSRIDIQLNAVDDSLVLPLNSIPQGIYLLRINNQTYKIIKK